MVDGQEIARDIKEMGEKGKNFMHRLISKKGEDDTDLVGRQESEIKVDDHILMEEEDNLKTKLIQQATLDGIDDDEEDFKLEPLNQEEVDIARQRIKELHPLQSEPVNHILPMICFPVNFFRKRKEPLDNRRASSLWKKLPGALSEFEHERIQHQEDMEEVNNRLESLL